MNTHIPLGRAAVAALVVVSLVSIAPARPRQTARLAQTFTVTNTADFGPGTLRQAILDANANPGLDTVAFVIAGNSRTIRPSVPLPEITDPVVLDATTQPGFAGTPIVELDGSNAGSNANGFDITAGDSTIRGFVIGGFSGPGIFLHDCNRNVVAGNYIGTNAAGTSAHANGTGIFIIESHSNRIDGNVISGNDVGIFIRDVNDQFDESRANTIEGNVIGADATGQRALGNTGPGVSLLNARLAFIGGRDAAAANVIAFNGGAGVRASSQGGARILSNSIHDNGGGGIDFNLTDAFVIYPEITYVEAQPGSVRIRGGLAKAYSFSATEKLLVQFFANNSCPNGPPFEGETLIGETELDPNEHGIATFDVTFAATLPAGGGITATTTSFFYDGTSSFSPCVGDTGGCERPFVVAPPRNVNVAAGDTATFSIGVVGSEPLAYQWYRSQSGAYVAIPGANSAEYTTDPLAATSQYKVIVSNGCGTAESVVTAAVCTGPPVIDVQPADTIVGTGATTTLSVQASPIGSYLSYQWYRGQSGDTSDPVAGALGSGLSVSGDDGPGVYWVRVSNGCGSVDSASAHVTVGPIITSVKATASKLVIKGTGFGTSVTVSVDGLFFLDRATIKRGRKVVQKGKLQNDLTIDQAIPHGSTVTIYVYNYSDTSYLSYGSFVYTRP